MLCVLSDFDQLASDRVLVHHAIDGSQVGGNLKQSKHTHSQTSRMYKMSRGCLHTPSMLASMWLIDLLVFRVL